MAKRMAIRVKIFDHCEYVEVTEEMLTNPELFLRHVLNTFGLDPTQAASSYLFDQDNFMIPVDLFPVVIPYFVSPALFLKITFALHNNIGFDMELEDFLKKNGCKSIFFLAAEATKNQLEMDTKNVHFLAEKLVHFIDQRDSNGEPVDPQQVADSLVRLMPCIKMETLYKQKKGILFNKLYYRKYAKANKKIESQKGIASESTQDLNHAVAEITEDIESLSLEEELSNLLYFKSCIVDKEKNILKIKMQQTIALREKTIRKRETTFIESFPFYFVDPDLILFDYSIRFANDANLIEKWPKLQVNILNLLNRADAEDCTSIGFDSETTSFLMLLRSITMKKTFHQNVEKLIVYSDDVTGSPENLVLKKNVYPYIIAVGDDKEKITNYYIDIENHLIPVPSDFNFLKAFDMFFKCHKVFHIEYSPSFVRLMHFIDYFIFETKNNKEIDLTITMRKIAEKLHV